GCIDHAERQAALEILRRGNAVAALLGEEIRPCFELVIVDRLGVAGVEVFHRELELDVHVNLDQPPPAAPRAPRAFPQRRQAWAWRGAYGRGADRANPLKPYFLRRCRGSLAGRLGFA